MAAKAKLERIKLHATRFRTAIELCDLEAFPSFKDFPLGACGDASLLLGEFFFDQGEGEWRYVAQSRLGQNGQTHAWLEKDGLIVDITADQFLDMRGRPVIVTMDRDWHGQFTVDRNIRARIESSAQQAEMLRMIYQRLLQSLR